MPTYCVLLTSVLCGTRVIRDPCQDAETLSDIIRKLTLDFPLVLDISTNKHFGDISHAPHCPICDQTNHFKKKLLLILICGVLSPFSNCFLHLRNEKDV